MIIILSVLAQIIFATESVYGDCGIPGVPAFARIRVVSDTEFSNMTNFPEGYAIKYDCFSDGKNFIRDTYGIDTRECKNSVWEPWQMASCKIDDPDDGTTQFVIDIKKENETVVTNGTYKNDWLLFDNKNNYNSKIKANFALNVTTGNYLWTIKFAKDYPAEKDHSFVVVMQFVVQHSDSFNYTDIVIDAKSSFSTSIRTCRRKIEIDYVHKLFTFKQNLEVKDQFYKITLECRDNWNERAMRWYNTSSIEIFKDINITIIVNTTSSKTRNIELLLTQLIIDADCGYPDLPKNAFYTKRWMNPIFGCTDGKLVGQSNVSCNYDGKFGVEVPKCCVGDECEAKGISGITIVIIILSLSVMVLMVIVLALFLRSRKRQRLANLERAKQDEFNMDKYDDVCDDYEQIGDQEYAEVNYSMVDKGHLELYDDSGYVVEGRYTKRMDMSDLSRDGDYVKMARCDDYLTMNPINNPNTA